MEDKRFESRKNDSPYFVLPTQGFPEKRPELPRASREAAQEYSPGRKPWVKSTK
jgi:hypothetical protein